LPGDRATHEPPPGSQNPGGRPDAGSRSPAAWNSGPLDEHTTPADLKVKLKEQTLTVAWKDGVTRVYSLAQLRRHCPCATCRTQREDRTLLPILNIKADASPPHVTSAQLTGNYAIQFTWSDGHNAGIFDFRYLRTLPGA